MFRLDRLDAFIPDGPAETPEQRARRGNRRRLKVFVLVFLMVAAAGLSLTFSRPAEYRARTRLTINSGKPNIDLPAAGGAAAANAAAAMAAMAPGMLPGAGDASALNTEAAVLTSRESIQAALLLLQQRKVALEDYGADKVEQVQSHLTVEMGGGNSGALATIYLSGHEAAQLAPILNALVEAYGQHQSQRYISNETGGLAALQAELQVLEKQVALKRQELDAFRIGNDIVSDDKSDNHTLSSSKSMSDALNAADNRVIQAESRLRTLKAAAGAGKAVVRSKDDPTLAALESRASQLRENLREQERTYTPAFMAMDPAIRGMKARLADLERQIQEEKQSAGQTAVAEAEDEVAAARQAQSDIREQMKRERASVQDFTQRFNTYKQKQLQLEQMEKARAALEEKVLQGQSSVISRRPGLEVIEAAVTPQEVWRPDYSRDAGISLGVALLLALMVMAVVELFNRGAAQPAAQVVVPQPWISVGMPPGAALPGQTFNPLLADQAPLPPQGMLQGQPNTFSPSAASLPPPLPRELSLDEGRQLLAAARGTDFLLAALFLAGADAADLPALRDAQADVDGQVLRLGGVSGRQLYLPRLLLDALTGAEGEALRTTPPAEDEIRRRLMCLAHDAGLPQPADLGPDTLRHGYIAHLVRQGLRFSELEAIVGPLSAEQLAAYTTLSPFGPRLSASEVDLMSPVLRGLA